MKKLILSLFLSLTFLIASTGSAYAVSLSPSSGTFPVTGNKTINIVATNSSTAIKLRLVVTNARVVSYSAPTGSFLTIGVCDAEGGTHRSVSATKYEVCVDIASTGSPVSNGSSLGTLTLASLSGAGGDFTIEGGPQNGYSTTDGFQAVSGVLGSYTFGSTTTADAGNRVTTLPNTAISDYMPGRGLLGGAILLSGFVSLAVAIKIFLLDKRKEIF